MLKFDELKLYRGDDVEVVKGIVVKQPTLDEIYNFGEKEYWASVHSLCATPADFKWQLWDMGIDYTTIDDFELFIQLTYATLASRKGIRRLLESGFDFQDKTLADFSESELDKMNKNPMELIVKDFDFADFQPYIDEEGSMILYNKKDEITIDRFVFHNLVSVIRKIHFLKRNAEKPGNEATKLILIEDAKEEAMMNKNKPYSSPLLPLISSLTVYCKLCGDDKIWDMKINSFLDNTKRATKIQDASALLQGLYSGMVSSKGLDKERLSWTSQLM